MEKFSYPDSTDSSPRSREIEFDNPPPWDDQNPNQNQQQQSYKVRFMCSYGGKIQPRPHDNQLTYVNGETKILSVDRGIRFPVLASKLSAVCGGGGGDDVTFKYQLPGEDLDALISVTNDDDLEHMMHEYDRLLRMSSKPARMRLFLFPSASSASGRFGSQGSTQSDRDRFVEALNSVPRLSDSEKSVSAPPPNNADFLFGSDKVVAPPPPQTPPETKLPLPDPPLFNDPRVIQPDHGVNPMEIQRQMQEFQKMHIRDQEQQQEAVYRRKSNEDGLTEATGGYFSPPYAQNPAPPPPQPTIPQTNPQALPPMTNFWQGNHNPGGVFTTTTPGLGLPEQPVYMIPTPTPSPVYHAPPPQQPQGIMRPVNQGGYYPPVQRMASDTYREQHQTPYNVAQLPTGTIAQQQQQPPPPFTSDGAPPPPQYAAVPPSRQVVGLPPDTSAYTQVTYTGGMGKQVYYTEAPPPSAQYHGIGLPVNGMGEVRSGPDGKLIAMNMATKVSSQSSDSAV
ncbi:PREDICTED: leucine-rich repeat extensin-like protein 2 [Camelina sativa]|uniref:Leucine-rich repeat extensin-like protein 2 n=1 Tax=Camelina sativa TaxID=90675 RepID=A0ABM0XDB6_CAMSA|nr:PREDICTED: leucine-rich repeat extensin-like protein 2 [Camelina sativa]